MIRFLRTHGIKRVVYEKDSDECIQVAINLIKALSHIRSESFLHYYDTVSNSNMVNTTRIKRQWRLMCAQHIYTLNDPF